MNRFKTIRHYLAMAAIVIFTGLSISSCASSNKASTAKKRQGFMLMDKSEYSMNKGRFKPVKRSKAIKKRKKNSHKKDYR